jgi:type II secretory pathway pseudopilin PulG
MRNNKGITLIALVVTIIILLILAGISIAMLTGENGILTNASKTSTENAYYQAEEQVKLAFMAVKTEIMAQVVKDGQYDATKNYTEGSGTSAVTVNNVEALAKIVYDDLAKNNTKFVVKYKGVDKATTSTIGDKVSTGTALITVEYTDSNIDKDAIATGKPANESKVYYTITLDKQDAYIAYDLVNTTYANITGLTQYSE